MGWRATDSPTAGRVAVDHLGSSQSTSASGVKLWVGLIGSLVQPFRLNAEPGARTAFVKMSRPLALLFLWLFDIPAFDFFA